MPHLAPGKTDAPQVCDSSQSHHMLAPRHLHVGPPVMRTKKGNVRNLDVQRGARQTCTIPSLMERLLEGARVHLLLPARALNKFVPLPHRS